MHIEINGGGLFGGASINDFQVDLDQFIGNSNDILSAFKTVQNETYNLNGGVGSLGDAVEEIGRRIQAEETKIANAVEVFRETAEFISMAENVDRQVATLVNQNKEEFYQMHPWLRPPKEVEDDRNFLEKAGDYINGKIDEFSNAVEEAWEETKEALKKCWDSVVAFYEEHKEIINKIAATVLAVAGAVLAIAAVVASGGLALVPLLGALGCSVAAATMISTAIAVAAVVTTVVAAVMNVADIWFEIDNAVFQTFKAVFNVASLLLNITYSIGSIYNAVHHTSPAQYIAEHSGPTKITNINQLSSSQTEALRSYTGNDTYQNINGGLRGTEQLTPENAARVKEIQSALGNSSLPDDMVLYRGTGMDELGALKNLPADELVGKTFTQEGFLSTSTSESFAGQMTKNLNITIHAPAGSPGLDISAISQYGTREAEILFNSGRQMLITGAEKIDGIMYIIVELL